MKMERKVVERKVVERTRTKERRTALSQHHDVNVVRGERVARERVIYLWSV